jgi:hypothetical protein
MKPEGIPKVVAVGVILMFAILFAVGRQPKAKFPPGSPFAPPLEYSDYVVKKTVAGADSDQNLGQMYACVKNKDEACERAMLLDGRAYYVPQGTMIRGQEDRFGAFSGTVTSGALVGKEIYIPVEALK